MEELKFSVSSLLDLSTSGSVDSVEVKSSSLPSSREDLPQDLSTKSNISCECGSFDYANMEHDEQLSRYWNDLAGIGRISPLGILPPPRPVYTSLDDVIAQGIAMMWRSSQKHLFHSQTLPHCRPTAGFVSTAQQAQRVREPTALRRAVFSEVQRQGLELAFRQQAYITKPERRVLAESLGLRDVQVKIWFQNRRMKWRNIRASTNRGLLHTDSLQTHRTHLDTDYQKTLHVKNQQNHELLNTLVNASNHRLSESHNPEQGVTISTIETVPENHQRGLTTQASICSISFDPKTFE